ncbi:MAG: cell wall hydrolase [Clostridia bacterium]|nr:cell wall hydrolase [Clostridia bacterium]
MMRRFMIVMLAVLLFAVPVSGADLSPADREYLIRAVSSSYPDVGMAGRVGICSVVLTRMDDPRFPDTAAEVTAYFGDGCFSVFGEPDEKARRLTEDALEMALSGADPTGGALYFTVLDDGKPVYDLKFDNSGEKKRDRALYDMSRNCTLLTDGIGFRK